MPSGPPSSTSPVEEPTWGAGPGESESHLLGKYALLGTDVRDSHSPLTGLDDPSMPSGPLGALPGLLDPAWLDYGNLAVLTK